MDYKQVKNILKEFNAKTEKELKDKINETWWESNCSVCGQKVDLRECHYENGDPVCKSCYE